MAITNSGKKGNWDFNYPKIYSLSFLNFELDFGNDDVIQYLSFSNEDHPEIRYDYIKMVFVRLSKFSKSLEECHTLQDKLIFSLRHAHELKDKPEQFGEDVFDKIFDIANLMNCGINSYLNALGNGTRETGHDVHASPHRRWRDTPSACGSHPFGISQTSWQGGQTPPLRLQLPSVLWCVHCCIILLIL
jgi:hypothetical protein